MLVKKLFWPALLFLAQSFAAQTVIPVVQDKYQSSISENGKSKILKVGEETDQKSWLLFPTEFLPGNTITKAYLGLYVNALSAEGELEVNTFDSDIPFPDPEIHFTLSPGAISSGTAISKSLDSDDEGSFQLIDITSLITSGTFAQYVSLVLESNGSLQASFDSREGARAPMLLLISEENQVTLPNWVESSNGDVDGDLSGTFPNLTVKSNAISSDKIADGAVTTGKLANSSVKDEHIESVDVSKVINFAHDHSNQALNPSSVNTQSLTATESLTAAEIFTQTLNMNDSNLGNFKMKMMVWETTLPAGTVANIELDGSPGLLRCPNPDGILYMTGSLNQSDIHIPMGTLGNSTSAALNRWEANYVKKPEGENDVLTFYYSSSLANNKVRIVCFFMPQD